MTTPVNFYADFQGLAALRQDAKAQDPAALKEAAKQFESLFTQMLLKSMREANKSFGDSMFGGEQGEMYQDMFDDQMAVHLAQGRGLGLADMLIRQLSQLAPATSAGLEAGGEGGELEKSGGAASRSDLQPTAYSLQSRSSAQPPASSRQPLAASREDFVRQMLPHAERAAEQLGVDPHALLAQAALETGWGKSVPSNAAGQCSFNLFGVKAGERWSGASVNVPTLEFEEGIPVRRLERFRAYDSPADSFLDYARLIANNPRYGNALGAGQDIASFASALQQGGYATDPRYADKIVAVARELRAIAAAPEFKSNADTPIAISGANHG
jgi:peptidoglycan hydrolase FlgJ